MSRNFFYKITAADLLAKLATMTPERRGEWSLQFAIDLVSGTTEDEYTQDVINEASEFRNKKAEAGRKGGKAKASSARAVLGDGKAEPSTPLPSNISSNSNNNTQPKKSSRFTPPSLQEVTDYCNERKNNIDPQKFINHYEANGWMRGKTPIKKWKACVKTWEGNDNGTSRQHSKAIGSGRRESATEEEFVDELENFREF